MEKIVKKKQNHYRKSSVSRVYNIIYIAKRIMSWLFTLKPIGNLDESITWAP